MPGTRHQFGCALGAAPGQRLCWGARQGRSPSTNHLNTPNSPLQGACASLLVVPHCHVRQLLHLRTNLTSCTQSQVPCTPILRHSTLRARRLAVLVVLAASCRLDPCATSLGSHHVPQHTANGHLRVSVDPAAHAHRAHATKCVVFLHGAAQSPLHKDCVLGLRNQNVVPPPSGAALPGPRHRRQ